VLAVILVCIGLVLVGTDRLLASVVGRGVARRAGRALGTGSGVVVRITSVPFLTQLASGLYREVEVSAPTCAIGSVEVHALRVRLSGVRASVRQLLAAEGLFATRVAARGALSARVAARRLLATRVAASATIPFSVLTARLPPGLDLRRSGADIGVSGWIGLMPVVGTLAVAASAQRISVVPKVLGVKGVVGFVITLPSLPPQLLISALRVTEAGLEVTLTGNDVILAPP
jgi:LmeA-like phospholipid-binding